MPGPVILGFRGRQVALERPDSYAALVEVARKFFNDLQHISEEDITFKYRPKFHHVDVELHRSAFPYVHDGAALHIVVPSLVCASPIMKSEDTEQPYLVKVESDHPEQLAVIDLTSDTDLRPSTTVKHALPLHQPKAAKKLKPAVEKTIDLTSKQSSQILNSVPLRLQNTIDLSSDSEPSESNLIARRPSTRSRSNQDRIDSPDPEDMLDDDQGRLETWKSGLAKILKNTHGIDRNRFQISSTDTLRVKNQIPTQQDWKGQYFWVFDGFGYTKQHDLFIVQAAERGPLFPDDLGIQWLLEFENRAMAIRITSYNLLPIVLRGIALPPHPLVLKTKSYNPRVRDAFEKQRRAAVSALQKQREIDHKILGCAEDPVFVKDDHHESIENGSFVPLLSIQCFTFQDLASVDDGDLDTLEKHLGRYIPNPGMRLWRPQSDGINTMRAATVLHTMVDEENSKQFAKLADALTWAKSHHGSHLCDESLCVSNQHGICDPHYVNDPMRKSHFRVVTSAVQTSELRRARQVVPLFCGSKDHYNAARQGFASDDTECVVGAKALSDFQRRLGGWMMINNFSSFRDIPARKLRGNLRPYFAEALVTYRISVVRDNPHLIEIRRSTLFEELLQRGDIQLSTTTSAPRQLSAVPSDSSSGPRDRQFVKTAHITDFIGSSDNNSEYCSDGEVDDEGPPHKTNFVHDDTNSDDDDLEDVKLDINMVKLSIDHPNVAHTSLESWRSARDKINQVVAPIERDPAQLGDRLSDAHLAWLTAQATAIAVRDNYSVSPIARNDQQLRDAVDDLNIKRIEFEHLAIHSAWSEEGGVQDSMNDPESDDLVLKCVMCSSCVLTSHPYSVPRRKQRPKEPVSDGLSTKNRATKWAYHLKTHISSPTKIGDRHAFGAKTVAWAFWLMLRDCPRLRDALLAQSRASSVALANQMARLEDGKGFSTRFLESLHGKKGDYEG